MQRATQVHNNFQNSKFILKGMLVAEKKGNSMEWQTVNKCKSGDELTKAYNKPFTNPRNDSEEIGEKRKLASIDPATDATEVKIQRLKCVETA